jgi:hypothetical protein
VPQLDRWTSLAALAALAVAALMLPIGIHSDDLEVVRFASAADYGELWTAPFRDLYYRPLVSTLVKIGADTVGVNPLLRAAHAALVIATAWMFAATTRDLVGPARLSGSLCLLAAPFTFVAIAPFGVGIGDSIAGVALLGCVRESLRDEPRLWVWLIAIAVALAAKESGLVVAVYGAAEALRRRRFVQVAIVEARPYILHTGYGFDMLTVVEQQQRFGDQPLPLRVYTAASNLIAALLYVPYKGQLAITPAIVAFTALTAGTTAIAAVFAAPRWRRWWPLFAVLPANAAIGFAYARPRIMFAAYVGIAVVFASAIDHLWRRGRRRVVIAALAAWVAALASALARLVKLSLL